MSLTVPVKTPIGLTMPAVAYAAWIAAAITAGSAIGLAKLAYPVWVWPLNFLILWGAASLWVRATATPAPGSASWRVDNKRLFVGSAVGFVLAAGILGAVVALL